MHEGAIIDGGHTLQPVLYALAAESRFEAPVTEGRLYYCTLAAGYAQRSVRIDQLARGAAQRLAKTIDDAIAAGDLPAYPEKGACRWCDYRPICGAHEEYRTGRKARQKVAPLLALRAER
jgi:radical SAM protein with 4Fe4S-binding SPASM domain